MSGNRTGPEYERGGLLAAPLRGSSCWSRGSDRQQRPAEGGGAGGERDAEAARRVQVGELLGDVADAVAARERGDRDGAQHAERLARRVEEGRARVAGDVRRHGVDRVAPAIAVVADALALLGAQLGDAAA